VAQLSQRKLKTVIVVGQLSRTRDPQKELPTFSADRVAYAGWNDFLKAGDDGPAEIQFNRGPAMRPLWILYSSGTTGKPKAIVHTHGGMLLATAVNQQLHCDALPTDVFLQFTTLGWMMVCSFRFKTALAQSHSLNSGTSKSAISSSAARSFASTAPPFSLIAPYGKLLSGLASLCSTCRLGTSKCFYSPDTNRKTATTFPRCERWVLRELL
jgi:acyl-CoA synthetase (AMP-forming)/AMP-acid ligase II